MNTQRPSMRDSSRPGVVPQALRLIGWIVAIGLLPFLLATNCGDAPEPPRNCIADSECFSEEICDSSVESCRPGCRSDENCNDGRLCSFGPQSTTGLCANSCDSDADCLGTLGTCFQGRCIRSNPVSCADSADACRPFTTCWPPTEGPKICIGAGNLACGGSLDDAPACSAGNSDCLEGQVCGVIKVVGNNPEFEFDKCGCVPSTE